MPRMQISLHRPLKTFKVYVASRTDTYTLVLVAARTKREAKEKARSGDYEFVDSWLGGDEGWSVVGVQEVPVAGAEPDERDQRAGDEEPAERKPRSSGKPLDQASGAQEASKGR